MSDTRLASAFADREVAALYRHRPPYPAGVFVILERLLVEPHTILDAGAGSGALARELVGMAQRVDALDPSEAMIEQGKKLPRGNDPRLRWRVGRAEDGPVDPPYGLITCGASLHWMDHAVVLPRFRELLAPKARLAIVDTENIQPSTELREDALVVIRKFSSIKHHVETREMLDDLASRGLLTIEGSEETPPVPVDRSLDEYLGSLGSTATLNHATLGPRAADFDREMRAVFARHGMDRVRYGLVGRVVWGRPA